MKGHRRSTRRTWRSSPWERLDQRIEAFAAREGHHTNAEIIRRMRQAYFAEVDELEKSGAVKIPR